MNDFQLDYGVSIEENIGRFHSYVVTQYAAQKHVCRCSKEECREAVPRGTLKRALGNEGYRAKSTVSQHKKWDAGHEGIPTNSRRKLKGYWTVEEILNQCEPYLRRKHDEGRVLDNGPVELPVGGLLPAGAVQLVECS
jgi:hypothetical protein